MLSAEWSVLGDLLISPEVLPLLRQSLTPEDFDTETGRRVYETACALHDGGEPVDVITIRTQLPDVPDDFFTGLMDATPTAAYVEAHIEALRQERVRRVLLNAVTDAQARLTLGEPPGEVLAQLRQSTEEASQSVVGNDLVDSMDAFTGYWSNLGKRKVLPTGYRSLDRLLGGGLVMEGLYILAARPGIGKTMLALQIAENCGVPVLFVSLEMSISQLSARRISIAAGINGTDAITGNLTEEEQRKAAQMAPILSQKPIFFNRRPWATVEDIRMLGLKVKGLGLIIVDYLGLIRHTEGNTLYEKVTATSGALKRMARSLGIPVLCLAQLNRVSGGGGRPKTSELRDSGAIEQDADGVLLLHNPMMGAAEQDLTQPESLECILGKNRHGPTGIVTMNFYKSNGRIREVYTGR